MKRKWWGVAAVLVAVVSVRAEAANLLTNPGFELPVLAGGDTFGAVGWNVFGGGTFTIKVAPHSGDNAFKTFGQTSGAFQDFAASPGQLWSGSTWALNPSFDAMTGAQIATANIEWRDAGSNVLSFLASTPSFTAATPTGSTAADYVKLQVSGVAPAGTATARFVVLTGAFAGAGGGAPFFDDASFELVPEPGSLALAGLSLASVWAAGRRRA